MREASCTRMKADRLVRLLLLQLLPFLADFEEWAVPVGGLEESGDSSRLMAGARLAATAFSWG